MAKDTKVYIRCRDNYIDNNSIEKIAKLISDGSNIFHRYIEGTLKLNYKRVPIYIVDEKVLDIATIACFKPFSVDLDEESIKSHFHTNSINESIKNQYKQLNKIFFNLKNIIGQYIELEQSINRFGLLNIKNEFKEIESKMYSFLKYEIAKEELMNTVSIFEEIIVNIQDIIKEKLLVFEKSGNGGEIFTELYFNEFVNLFNDFKEEINSLKNFKIDFDKTFIRSIDDSRGGMLIYGKIPSLGITEAPSILISPKKVLNHALERKNKLNYNTESIYEICENETYFSKPTLFSQYYFDIILLTLFHELTHSMLSVPQKKERTELEMKAAISGLWALYHKEPGIEEGLANFLAIIILLNTYILDIQKSKVFDIKRSTNISKSVQETRNKLLEEFRKNFKHYFADYTLKYFNFWQEGSEDVKNIKFIHTLMFYAYNENWEKLWKAFEKGSIVLQGDKARIFDTKEKRVLKDYKGVKLVFAEFDVIKSLNKRIKEELKPVDYLDLDYSSTGFESEDGHIRKISICGKNVKMLKSLPDIIGNLLYLTHLDLSHNLLEKLPDSIIELKSLEYLNLMKNKLKELPEDIADLTKLRFLDLYDNKISLLPESITNLTELEYLDLRSENGYYNDEDEYKEEEIAWIEKLRKNGCKVNKNYSEDDDDSEVDDSNDDDDSEVDDSNDDDDSEVDDSNDDDFNFIREHHQRSYNSSREIKYTKIPIIEDIVKNSDEEIYEDLEEIISSEELIFNIIFLIREGKHRKALKFVELYKEHSFDYCADINVAEGLIQMYFNNWNEAAELWFEIISEGLTFRYTGHFYPHNNEGVYDLKLTFSLAYGIYCCFMARDSEKAEEHYSEAKAYGSAIYFEGDLLECLTDKSAFINGSEVFDWLCEYVDGLKENAEKQLIGNNF